MKRYCVLGYPVRHSLSPKIHNAAFKKFKIDARYEKCEVKPLDLADFMRGFREKYAGANVTVPHKEAVIKYLDKLSPEARKIGAVNTIVNRGGKLIGYNTDVVGAMTALRLCHPELVEGSNRFLRGTAAIVLGAGGAARAVVYGLKKAGAKVLILNRTLSRAKKLAKDFCCEYGKPKDLRKNSCDILINTTSVGMWPNIKGTPLPNLLCWLGVFSSNIGAQPPSIRLSAASRGRSPHAARSASLKMFSENTPQPALPVVMDVIYRPRMTKLLSDAKKAGCRIITGDKMFLAQAAASFRLWTGEKN